MSLVKQVKAKGISFIVGMGVLSAVSDKANPDAYSSPNKPINWVNALAFFLLIFIISLALLWSFIAILPTGLLFKWN